MQVLLSALCSPLQLAELLISRGGVRVVVVACFADEVAVFTEVRSTHLTKPTFPHTCMKSCEGISACWTLTLLYY